MRLVRNAFLSHRFACGAGEVDERGRVIYDRDDGWNGYTHVLLDKDTFDRDARVVATCGTVHHESEIAVVEMYSNCLVAQEWAADKASPTGDQGVG